MGKSQKFSAYLEVAVSPCQLQESETKVVLNASQLSSLVKDFQIAPGPSVLVP